MELYGACNLGHLCSSFMEFCLIYLSLDCREQVNYQDHRMSRVNLCPSQVDKFKKDILLGYILDILIKFTYYFDLEKSNLVN